MNLFGRQRGILAHEEKNRNCFGFNKASLQDAGSAAMTSLFPRKDVKTPRKADSAAKEHRSTTAIKPAKQTMTLDPSSKRSRYQ